MRASLKKRFDKAWEDSKPPDFKEYRDTPSQRRDLSAFMTLDRLVPGKGDIVSAAEHDQIFLGVGEEELDRAASDADIRFLAACGVFYSSEFDCLSMYA
jgi:hypothetical protein